MKASEEAGVAGGRRVRRKEPEMRWEGGWGLIMQDHMVLRRGNMLYFLEEE